MKYRIRIKVNENIICSYVLAAMLQLKNVKHYHITYLEYRRTFLHSPCSRMRACITYVVGSIYAAAIFSHEGSAFTCKSYECVKPMVKLDLLLTRVSYRHTLH